MEKDAGAAIVAARTRPNANASRPTWPRPSRVLPGDALFRRTGRPAQPGLRQGEPGAARRHNGHLSRPAKTPQVAAYSVKKTYGRLLDMVEKAFHKEKPLFTLAIYYPLAYYKGAGQDHRSVRRRTARSRSSA